MLHLSKSVPRMRSVGMYRCGGPYLADSIEDARVEAWHNRRTSGKCCIRKIVACDLTTGEVQTVLIETVGYFKKTPCTEKEKELGTLYVFDTATGRLTGERIYR